MSKKRGKEKKERAEKAPALITREYVDSKKLYYLDFAGLHVQFQRTCRVPEGVVSDLPAGLGAFPVYRAHDFSSGTPKGWRNSDYFMPMYAQEAMWVNFLQRVVDKVKHPHAVIVAAGSINAITGDEINVRDGSLDAALGKMQNYAVVPPQPWIDGWKDRDSGRVYQFVAAELGSGQTVEGQITGKEKIGGIQLIVYGPKKGVNLKLGERPRELSVGSVSYGPAVMRSPHGDLPPMESPDEPEAEMLEELMEMDDIEIGEVVIEASDPGELRYDHVIDDEPPMVLASVGGDASAARAGRPRVGAAMPVRSLGLGRGGQITQKIYPDDYGFSVWEKRPAAKGMIHLVSSEDFMQITGRAPPETPVTYEAYQRLGIPWYRVDDKKMGDAKGSDVFGGLKPVGEGRK